TARPSIICCKTVIGWGSPNKQGTAACHGAALGVDEVARARETLGWEYEPFEVPAAIYSAWSAVDAGHQAEQEWQNIFDAYEVAHPELAAQFKRRMRGELPKDWEERVWQYVEQADASGVSEATRKSSYQALNAYGPLLPELIGG